MKIYVVLILINDIEKNIEKYIKSEFKKMLWNEIMLNRYKFYKLLIFFIVISFSLYIYKDYGFGTDEHINRNNGGISFNYVIDTITRILNLTNVNIRLNEFNIDLHSYKDRDYGVAFDLPVMAIERILNINEVSEQYYLRHLLTHLVFLVGVIYFYKIIRKRFKSIKFGIIGALFLILSPRIFAESFYNNKDIVFMSFFIVALYYSIEFIKNINFKNGVMCAISTGIAIDIRIVGVILPMIVLSSFVIEIIKNSIKIKDILLNAALYFIFLISVIIIFWPWIWESPLINFFEAIKNMAKFRWLNWVLYRGHYYPSNNLPWHYLPIWILITTPIIYIIFSIIGISIITKNLFQNKFIFFKKKNVLIDTLIVALLLMPIVSVVILKSTIYDGWRQFYFLYPMLIYTAIMGCYELYKHSKKFVILLIIISSIFNMYWMIINHPYQFVYFNLLAGKNWNEKFEMDYWGLTNVAALRKISDVDNSKNIKIFGLGNTSMPQAFSLLKSSDANRFEFVKDYWQSDYVITNYRFLANKSDSLLLDILNKKCPIILEIKVDDKTIASVFKTCNINLN